jgi:hypothetical protein
VCGRARRRSMQGRAQRGTRAARRVSAVAPKLICFRAPFPSSAHERRRRSQFRVRPLGPGDRPASDRIHPHSLQVPALRFGVGSQRPHRAGRAARRPVVPRPVRAGHDSRGRPAAGAHAAALSRNSGRCARNRAALWPPRQAARDDWMARGARPMATGHRRRQALWPWRRRRRLCGVRFACRDHGIASAGHRACALRGDDRMLRGKRQLRSAVLPGGTRGARGQGRPRHRARLRLRQLRAALAPCGWKF